MPERPQAGRRFLLVEDHLELGKVTAEVLRLRGYEVDVASSGREAVALAGRMSHDVVLCDLHLPDMEGSEVARAIREVRREAIFVGLSAQDPDLIRSQGGGAFDLCFSKPLDFHALERELSAALRPPAPGREDEVRTQR